MKYLKFTGPDGGEVWIRDDLITSIEYSKAERRTVITMNNGRPHSLRESVQEVLQKLGQEV